ncbi:MAG: PAS domain S-box protein [Gemmatimonadaceae bacterium]|nr:PAS domain S-box protein [Gemmatimonadaceae bacterium]
MNNGHLALALSRTVTTNLRRLAILVAFTFAMGFVRLVAFPVPLRAFGLFAVWILASAIYHAILKRGHASTRAVDTLQTLAFIIDLTFLTAMYSFVGGGWWMGATIHAVIAMAAFASLPRRRAQIVAVYAVFAFVVMLFSQAAGWTELWPFLGVQTIRGNYSFVLAASLFGGFALIAGAYVQDLFVRIMRRSQERYRVILQTAPDIILTTNHLGIVRSANEATYLHTGLPSDGVIGRYVWELVHPEDAEEMRRQAEAGLQGESRQFEVRYNATGVGEICLLCNCNPIREEGRVVGILLVGRDITDRKSSEERLRSSEMLLAETQRLAKLGSWEWDIGKNTVTWSDELYRLFGVRKNGRITLETFIDIVHPDDRERVRKTVEHTVRTNEPFAYNHRIVTTEGETKLLYALGHTVLDERGEVIRLIGSAQDITEQSNLTEQLRQAQKMEAVGRLAGGVAHDFNNLLTVMDCHVQFLLQDLDASTPQRQDVEAIKKATENAAALTRQLLAFSRKQILQPKLINLNDSIANIESLLGRLLGETVQVVTRLDPALGQMKADPGQIEQVLMNLAVNARDAMPKGGTLTIQTRGVTVSDMQANLRPGLKPGPHALLAVSDVGEGIPDDVRPHIFEPFFTTKEVGQGTGLGLATVYGIVKQSGGVIDVVSARGKGSTFNLYFPLTPGDAPEQAQHFSVTTGLTGTETILLVEDANALRAVATKILTSNGYKVLAAENGEAALRVFRKNDEMIDALLTDVVMPELGGRELAAIILADRPELPILFMSGYTETAALGKLGTSRGHGFIGKPFTPEALLRQLREVLDRSKASQAP